jgi:hypothetical protein
LTNVEELLKQVIISESDKAIHISGHFGGGRESVRFPGEG